MSHPVPTLETVAARAEVSRQTVSNVLNAPERVLPETRDRVLAAIAETGYRTRSAARQLRTGRSHVVGLRLAPLTDGINGAVLDRFLHALTEYAQSRDYNVMLFTARDDEQEIEHYRTLARTSDLDGFVLSSTHHGDTRTRWLTENGVPFVTFGRPWDPSGHDERSNHPWVDVDGRTGTRLAVEHLLAQGHRRIGYIGWPAGSDVGDDRRAGWEEAMEAARHGSPAELQVLRRDVEDAVAHGLSAARDLLDHEGVTALVCASDSLALGAVGELRTRGGARTAVVGFDDTPVAAAVGLTSVAQPLVEAARHAFDLVLDQIRGTSSPDRDPHVLLRPDLVVRASSTPAQPSS